MDFLADPFILKPLLMGAAFSLLAGPLGSVMVWRRMAFFGDAIAHSSLLGAAIAYVLPFSSSLILLGFCLVLAGGLSLVSFRSRVSLDSILAILSHGGLALGLVILALLGRPPINLSGFLFGDVLALEWGEVIQVFCASFVVLALIITFWRPVLTTLISEDLAQSEGIPTRLIKVSFALVLGAVIGLVLQTIGVLLMTALLIIPAGAARPLAKSPAQMMILASFVAFASFQGGVGFSYLWDLPTSPMIVVVALGIFVLLRLGAGVLRFVFQKTC